jgi:hypothetical protein
MQGADRRRRTRAKALKAGYKSKSKSFRDVVWVNLGNMKNVEHVPGLGYRLKKR